MRDLLQILLAAEGDDIITAADGLEALDKFILEQPDLVLMDIVMPGMNGFEATRKIKSLAATEKWVPVVMLTVLDDPEDFARGLEAGADDYLTKPVNPALLATKLKFMKRVLAAQADLFALQRFQTIFDHVLDGIIATNERGIVVSFNHAAEKIFGYPAGEILGRNVSVLMPIPDAYRHDAYMARYQFTGQATVMGAGRDIHGRRKDGSIIPISVGLTEVEWAGTRHFIGVISDISERKRAERSQEEIASQLHRYRERSEAEKQITEELLRKLIRLDTLQDPLLHWHLRPSEVFTGDVIAAHRTRDGRLLVLIADATGHGLAAAVSLLPVLGIFHTMSDKNFAVSDIVAEINKRLHEVLPVGRFVAAALIGVHEERHRVEIWNGGMPDMLLCRSDATMERVRSNHVALGILPPSEFDARCITLDWTQPGHLLAMSDGIIEAENGQGDPLGLERLCTAASGAKGEDPLPLLLHRLDQHLAGAPPHDDIALAAIRLN
jgi:PAS domain S-box-containing protein